MTENNAAQPGLTDDEIEAVRRALEIYAECYDTMTRIAAREGREPVASPVSVAFDIRKNMVNAVVNALSKLRAEGVQAGDERVSLRGAANLAFNALHECKPAKGAEKQYSDAIQALQSALHDIAYTVNRTATPQQFANHLQREARAALASAPVAGEADQPDIDTLRRIGAAHDARHAAPQASEAAAELPAPVNGEARAWSFAAPGPVAAEVRDAALEEAAQALEKRADESRNEYDHRKEPYFEGSADAYDVGAFVVRALKTQADKDGGDCAKGAGDGQQKYWLCCGSKDPNHPNRRAPDCFNADRAKWGTADQHSVVKQSLTATQTGEKGEKDAH